MRSMRSVLWTSLLVVSACRQASTAQLKTDEVESPSLPFVAEKDLAIVLPLETSIGFTVADTVLVRKEWLGAIDKMFEKVPESRNPMQESPAEIWKLVAMRLVPCEAFGRAVFHRLEEVCWPQVRLVWQPIARGVPFFSHQQDESPEDRARKKNLLGAHDKALHITYPVNPISVLAPADAKKVAGVMAKALAANEAKSAEEYDSIIGNDLREFKELRKKVVKRLLEDSLALREKTIDEEKYKDLAVRPEFPAHADRFNIALQSFLLQYAKAEDVFSVTGFTVPAGHMGKVRDLWTFFAFRVVGKDLLDRPFSAFDPITNKAYVEIPENFTKVHVSTDDAAFQAKTLTAENKAIADNLLISTRAEAKTQKVQRILDGSQVTFVNASCGTCHKLTDDNFDFHNLGYFENKQSPTISPRVTKDVARDLDWLRMQRIELKADPIAMPRP